MANQTAARDDARMDGLKPSYLVAASTKIWKGELLCVQHGNTPTSEGYAIQPRAAAASQTDAFLGVAYGSVDNSAGADGAKRIDIRKTGAYIFVTSGAALTDVGLAVYAADSQTVTKTSTNAMLVGYIEEFISTTSVRVRIDRAVQ